MLILPVLLAALAATPAALPLIAARTIALDGPVVRVGDVLALDGLARGERKRIAPLMVARLPAQTRRYSLRRSGVAALVRRRVPNLPLANIVNDDPIAFTIASVDHAAVRLGCVALVVPVARGDVVTPDAVRRVACVEAGRGKIVFERGSGRIVAARALDTGAPLGRFHFPTNAVVAKGDLLHLVSRIGPVTIERAVTAMQASMTGSRLFVRDGDSQVYSARFGSGVER